jgi:hypothetical protein
VPSLAPEVVTGLCLVAASLRSARHLLDLAFDFREVELPFVTARVAPVAHAMQQLMLALRSSLEVNCMLRWALPRLRGGFCRQFCRRRVVLPPARA